MSDLCLRCGNEITDEEASTVHKCPKCKDIRFKRKHLNPIDKKIRRNFQRIQRSMYHLFITGFYQFGSFSEGKPECGDIDFLITYDEDKLRRFVKCEISQFHFHNEGDLSEDDLDLLAPSYLINGFWDFRTCDEYPDCLYCHSSRGCHLPEEDYSSPLHTYCQLECKNCRKNDIPVCWLSDCVYLDHEIQNRILKDIRDVLIEGGIDYLKIKPDMSVRMIDIVIKKSVDELRKEFASMKMKKDLNLIRIF